MEFLCACRFDFRGGERKEKERGKDGGGEKEGGRRERGRERLGRREGGREGETFLIILHTHHTFLAVCDPSSNTANSTHTGQHGTDLPTPRDVCLHLPLCP